MGMVLQLRRGDEAILGNLLSGGDSFENFINPDDFREAPKGTLIDLDKSWHAIHFLLTGEIWCATLPQGTLLAGEEVTEDSGYGPARLLNADQVANFANFLAGKPDDFVEKAFDFDALQEAKIYPTIWDRRDPEDVNYVSQYFRKLKQFFKDAATDRNFVVIAIT